MSELVAGAIVTAPSNLNLVEVAKLMVAEGVGSVAVVDEAEGFIGIVSIKDLLWAVEGS